MSQSIRDLMANKKFSIPLLILLGFSLVGLILAGVVLLQRPGGEPTAEPTQVAGAALTPSVTAADLVTFTPAPTNTPTAEPSPTLLPVAPVASPTLLPVAPVTSVAGGTPAATATARVAGSASPTPQNTATPDTAVSQATATTAATDSDGELAQTGLGSGLILLAGGGLAALAVAAHRLRRQRG